MKPTLFTPETWAEFTQQLKILGKKITLVLIHQFCCSRKKIVWGLDPASDSVEITNIVDADDESTYKSIDDF